MNKSSKQNADIMQFYIKGVLASLIVISICFTICILALAGFNLTIHISNNIIDIESSQSNVVS